MKRVTLVRKREVDALWALASRQSLSLSMDPTWPILPPIACYEMNHAEMSAIIKRHKENEREKGIPLAVWP